MEHMYSVCQCVLSVSVIVVSVRLCMGVGGKETHGGGGAQAQDRTPSGSVSACLRLCLGWVGAVGGAVGVPVSVLLNMRDPQCLYTCITLVCCPLLVRQFTMCLLLLLSLDCHLQHRMADRYRTMVTRRRALCVVLLCWVGSVLSSFAQFIGWDALDTWGGAGEGGTAGLGMGGLPPGVGNRTSPPPPPPPRPKYPQDRSVIGKYLPYGGFLSKFYVEDHHNFTYAEIHGSHWGVCAQDTVLSPQYMVYVYGVTVFLLPLVGLLGVYLDLLCVKPKQTPIGLQMGPPKRDSPLGRSLALSLCLLVLLCLPLHITHALLLFAPRTMHPTWAHPIASFLFQVYDLVPPLLYTPPQQRREGERPHLAPSSRSKAVGRALCSAVQGASWCPQSLSLKKKVCPDV